MSNEPSSPTSKAPKSWRIGTLVYSSGGLAALFFWLLWGDFAWQLKDRAVFPVAQLMLKNMSASDFIVGALIGSFPAAIGMILGPIISVKSDRHRGHWGRRIPFLFISAPFAAVSMMLLGVTPKLAGALHGALGVHAPSLVILNISIFALLWTVFEIASVVTNSVFGGLVNDTVPNEVIGRFFGLFRGVGLLAGILFNYSIMGHAESHYIEIMGGIGLLYGVGFMMMCLRVKEGVYPSPESKAEGVHPMMEIKTYVRECYGHSFYLWLFGGYSLAMIAPNPVNVFSVFYAKSIGMDLDTYGKCLVVTYVISLSVAYFLGALADRFHPLRLSIYSILLYALAMLWGGFFATSVNTFMVAFILHGVLAGTFFTATASLGQRLFPKSKFAQFSSAMGITTGVGFMILPTLIGGLLDYSGHVYRYTFVCGGVLGLVGAACLWVAYGKFIKLGGPENYVPPIVEPSS
jgi:maltose/moltooligosaccharide transporter